MGYKLSRSHPGTDELNDSAWVISATGGVLGMPFYQSDPDDPLLDPRNRLCPVDHNMEDHDWPSTPAETASNAHFPADAEYPF